jgi:C-terminal peptidase prc
MVVGGDMSVHLSTLHIRWFVRRWGLLVLLLPCLLALIGCDNTAPTQTPTPSIPVVIIPTPTLLPEELRSSIFEEVWGTVKNKYLYKDYRGVNWLALHDEYKPRALQAGSNEEFYTTIKDMVERLDDNHSGYWTPAEVREQDASASGRTDYAGIGITVQMEDDSEVVLLVYPGSPAEAAGLRRRDRITAVDGQPLRDPENTPGRIRGPVGTSVTLTVQSPGQAPRDIAIVRQHITSSENPIITQLNGDPAIGYLVISSFWQGDMDTRVEQALLNFTRRLADQDTPLKGLVIDLRGNKGGYITVTEGIVGQFMEGLLGTRRLNDSHQYSSEGLFQVVAVKGKLFNQLKSIPLVVLIDDHTGSSAEVFAAALQSKGRAKVIGTRSAGNIESLTAYDFSDGSRLHLATAYIELWDGTNLEGKGITPDVTIDVDWSSYPEKDDPHILEAVKTIQEAAGN